MDKIPPSLPVNAIERTNKSIQDELDKEIEYIKPKPVVITDIKMPMGSMIEFMIKWAIASIPAFIILCIIFGVVTAVLGGIFSGVFMK